MIGLAPLRRLIGGRLGWWLLMPPLLICAALVSFYLAFPSRTLQTRLQLELAENLGLQSSMSPPQLRFPPGLACDRLDLALPAPLDRPLPLRRVRVAPLWLSLLGKSPGLRFRAELNGGTLNGTARRDGQTTLAADQVAVEESLLAPGGLIIQGVLLDSRFDGLLPLQAPGQRNLALTLDRVRLNGLKDYGATEDSLELGRLMIRAEGEGKTLRLQQLTLQGGAVEGSGQGAVLLGATPAATRLNLTIQLRPGPGPGLDPTLRDLLNLVGSDGPNGSRRLRLSGSLQQPALR
ncbi:MAG: type II secretion system protein GspN [Syntrophotaleaceae bacterium]